MKRACNLLIYRALEASVKKYADTIGKPTAATPKFEVKRHGTSGHGNDCMPVPQGGYSASNFAGAADSQFVNKQEPLNLHK